jgi:Flp pilus assembly protein TadD
MSVLLHFEEYQKARVKFVQAVAEAATRPQNIEVMNNAGVMQLLRPLLLDNVRSLTHQYLNSKKILLLEY